MRRKLKGIRQKGNRWEVNVRVNGTLYHDTFALTTPLEEMRDWIAQQQQKFGGETSAAGSIAADLPLYRARVKALPTIKQRMAHLELWVAELGRDRPRNSVTSEEIELVLQAWLLAGLANGTVKKRRTSLQSFYVTMNGKKGKNPVKGTPIPQEPAPEARDIDYLRVDHAIAAMPTQRDTKKGLPPRVSLSKLRARVIAYTGIPPGLLKKVLPHDVALVGKGSVRVQARKKGKGVEARTVPLTAEGLAAFKLFHAGNAYGNFATESLNRSFKRGCQRAGLDPKAVHLYDLRHTFLTEMYRVTRDLATVGRLGLHAKGSKITARYAQGANDVVDAAAVEAFGASLVAKRQASLKAAPAPKPAKQLETKVGKTAKSIRRRRLWAVS